MADYKLHCFPESGNWLQSGPNACPERHKMATGFCRLYFCGQTRSEDYRKLNPMGEAPMLDHNGYLLSQSGVILHYLQEKTNQFGPRDEQEKHQILRWILFDNHKLTSCIGTLRFIKRFTDQGENEVTAFLEARSKGALKVLDAHLAQQKFAVGNQPTIADISMCGYLFFGDEVGFSLAAYENIGVWLDRIKLLPGWQHAYDLIPGKPSA